MYRSARRTLRNSMKPSYFYGTARMPQQTVLAKPIKPLARSSSEDKEQRYQNIAACNAWCSDHPDSQYCGPGGICREVLDEPRPVRSKRTPSSKTLKKRRSKRSRRKIFKR